ncbi:MAG: DNA methyltransferase [Janthinobacterium lividum]
MDNLSTIEFREGIFEVDEHSKIIYGNALHELSQRYPEPTFQCCVTSPPYWGLRDYGVDEQIGAESDLDAYIEKLVLVFRAVRNSLKDDGTLWLNIGDSYTSGGRTWRQSCKLPQ